MKTFRESGALTGDAKDTKLKLSIGAVPDSQNVYDDTSPDNQSSIKAGNDEGKDGHDDANTFTISAVVHHPFTAPEKCFQNSATDAESLDGSEYVVPEVSIDEPYTPLTSQLITVQSCEERPCDIGTRINPANTTEPCGADDDEYLVPEIYEEIEGLADSLQLTERPQDTSPSQSKNEGQDNVSGNGNYDIYETPM